MRVVIDCNVLVSAARIAGVCRQVIDNVVRWHDIVLSDPVLAEYETVAERPKHARYRDACETRSGSLSESLSSSNLRMSRLVSGTMTPRSIWQPQLLAARF